MCACVRACVLRAEHKNYSANWSTVTSGYAALLTSSQHNVPPSEMFAFYNSNKQQQCDQKRCHRMRTKQLLRPVTTA